MLENYDIALVQEPYPRHRGQGNYTRHKKEGENLVKTEIWAKLSVRAKSMGNLTV